MDRVGTYSDRNHVHMHKHHKTQGKRSFSGSHKHKHTHLKNHRHHHKTYAGKGPLNNDLINKTKQTINMIRQAKATFVDPNLETIVCGGCLKELEIKVVRTVPPHECQKEN